MDLNLRRSRLAYNTASGKESMAPKFCGELPMNPYFQYKDPSKEPELGTEYVGFMGDIISSREQNK